VLEPEKKVHVDVERFLSAPQLSPWISGFGHAYDLDTGRVSTVVPTTAMQQA